MSLIVAGIDPSVSGTAVCVLESNDIIDLTTFVLPKDSKGISRLNWLAIQLNKILKKNNPTEIFIEGYSFGSRGRSTITLGELGGIFRLLLAKHWNGYYEVPPKTLKKFITGNGNSKKQVMLEKTYRKYKVGSEILKNDNEVDAYCLARCGTAYLTRNKDSTFAQYEIDALKGISAKCTL